jgi:hypothetical protein
MFLLIKFLQSNRTDSASQKVDVHCTLKVYVNFSVVRKYVSSRRPYFDSPWIKSFPLNTLPTHFLSSIGLFISIN